MSPFEEYDYWGGRLRAQFDERATGHISYSRSYNWWLYQHKRRVIHETLRRVPVDTDALDLGSGTGWVVAQLLGHGCVVTGCDISPYAVERLRADFPACTFHQTSIGHEPLPLLDASVTLVTAIDVMFHVTEDGAWREAVRETARVLRPGGRLVITDGLGSDDRTPDPHVRFRSLARWHEEAEANRLVLSPPEPYFTWLSRDRHSGRVKQLPDGLRGAVEYGLERWAPRQRLGRTPHMQVAVLLRQE